MSFVFDRVKYEGLNARQKESYNFQKVSAVLADYGFTTLLLSNDWNGADFVAQHRDGAFLKVQLKGRLSFCKKYEGQDLYVCFPDGSDWYIYPHDEVLGHVLKETSMGETKSWQEEGGYSYPTLSSRMREMLEPFRLRAEEARGVSVAE